mmetsp:Transcript_43621/g.99008  ORF Transcript_43621/g.99008 Transcript_43621/m.99008 type:complete len:144 (-) Transcript_43621:35-466(-)
MYRGFCVAACIATLWCASDPSTGCGLEFWQSVANKFAVSSVGVLALTLVLSILARLGRAERLCFHLCRLGERLRRPGPSRILVPDPENEGKWCFADGQSELNCKEELTRLETPWPEPLHEARPQQPKPKKKRKPLMKTYSLPS